jgi:hypothetical protein
MADVSLKPKGSTCRFGPNFSNLTVQSELWVGLD